MNNNNLRRRIVASKVKPKLTLSSYSKSVNSSGDGASVYVYYGGELLKDSAVSITWDIADYFYVSNYIESNGYFYCSIGSNTDKTNGRTSRVYISYKDQQVTFTLSQSKDTVQKTFANWYRINSITPGFVDSDSYDHIRDATYDSYYKRYSVRWGNTSTTSHNINNVILGTINYQKGQKYVYYSGDEVINLNDYQYNRTITTGFGIVDVAYYVGDNTIQVQIPTGSTVANSSYQLDYLSGREVKYVLDRIPSTNSNPGLNIDSYKTVKCSGTNISIVYYIYGHVYCYYDGRDGWYCGGNTTTTEDCIRLNLSFNTTTNQFTLGLEAFN